MRAAFLPRSLSLGFTVIEMLVVMTALALLLSVAAPVYLRQLDRATEASLRESLQTMRTALDQYAADRGRYPQAMTELVAAGYLRAVPLDPVTGRADWVLVQSPAGSDPANPPPAAESGDTGIRDLHSASKALTKTGVPYASF